MRLLLDTHALVWALAEPERLSGSVRRMIADGRNEVFFSAMSIFEIATKRASGRRTAPALAADAVVALATATGLRELPVEGRHAAAVETLALSHGDSFDKLLLAQAQIEDMRLVTHDKTLARYDSRTILF